MLKLYKNGLDIIKLNSEATAKAQKLNIGAFMSFCGIVRDEDGIDGLSFDIYEPLLLEWFKTQELEANKLGISVEMAHSFSDVFVGESSFLVFVYGKHRKEVLDYINLFVENFKSSATIWKYDLIGKKRIYKFQRSIKLEGSGVLF